MKRGIFVFVVATLIVGCATFREVSTMTNEERMSLKAIADEHFKCVVSKTIENDTFNVDMVTLVDQSLYLCDCYEKQIRDKFNEYKLNPYSGIGYVKAMRESHKRNAVELCLDGRKVGYQMTQ